MNLYNVFTLNCYSLMTCSKLIFFLLRYRILLRNNLKTTIFFYNKNQTNITMSSMRLFIKSNTKNKKIKLKNN